MRQILDLVYTTEGFIGADEDFLSRITGILFRTHVCPAKGKHARGIQVHDFPKRFGISFQHAPDDCVFLCCIWMFGHI